MEELCRAASEQVGPDDGVRIANYLCNGNYAISGGLPGCEVVEKIAKPDFKARMTVRLSVAGAFHTHFMQPAEERLRCLALLTLPTPSLSAVAVSLWSPLSTPSGCQSIDTAGRHLGGRRSWGSAAGSLCARVLPVGASWLVHVCRGGAHELHGPHH